MTHILQPLDVGVFKPFKAHFSLRHTTKYLAAILGQVITTDVNAALAGEAWPKD